MVVKARDIEYIHTGAHRHTRAPLLERANLLFFVVRPRPIPFLAPTMAHPSRRVPSPNPSHYYAVPQSPQNHYTQQRRTSRSNRTPNRAHQANNPPVVAPMPPRNDLAQGVATGAIGAGYGPYAVRHPLFLDILFNHIYCQARPFRSSRGQRTCGKRRLSLFSLQCAAI